MITESRGQLLYYQNIYQTKVKMSASTYAAIMTMLQGKAILMEETRSHVNSKLGLNLQQ